MSNFSFSAGSKDGEIRVECGRDLNGRARAVRKKVGHIFLRKTWELSSAQKGGTHFLGSSMPKYGKHFLTQKGGVHFFYGAVRKKLGHISFLEQDAKW